MDFRTRLRELRESTGLTQKECATLLNEDYASYNKWENGSNPNFQTVIKIAHHYNVSIDYLLGASDYRSINDIKSIDLNFSDLLDGEKSAIISTLKALTEFAKKNHNTRIPYDVFFGLLIGDIDRLISSYENVIFDIGRYEKSVVAKLFLDRIVHSNYPDVIDAIYKTDVDSTTQDGDPK